MPATRPAAARAGRRADRPAPAEEAENILRAADNRRWTPSRPRRRCPSCARRVHLAAGRPADAAAEGQAALAIAQTLGAHGYAATARTVLAMIELRRGDIAAATAPRLPSTTDSQFADLYARSETTAAQAQITEARDGPAAGPAPCSSFRPISRPARAADRRPRPGGLAGPHRTGRRRQRLAASVARTAAALADSNPGFPALAAAAAHARGLASRDPARLAQAAAEHPDPWASASAAEDLAVLHTSHGDRDQAIGYLKEALSRYQRANADRDQARVRMRLRKLGIRHRHWTTPADRPVTGWDSLTSTELAVASLVAQGLNNKQVAARMYISTHTVAHHLRQAFRKLAIASRCRTHPHRH